MRPKYSGLTATPDQLDLLLAAHLDKHYGRGGSNSAGDQPGRSAGAVISYKSQERVRVFDDCACGLVAGFRRPPPSQRTPRLVGLVNAGSAFMFSLFRQQRDLDRRPTETATLRT